MRKDKPQIIDKHVIFPAKKEVPLSLKGKGIGCIIRILTQLFYTACRGGIFNKPKINCRRPR